ncbi:sulfotransferase [Oscillatoria sp. CS-180]|uniref:sulfotransferase n=1 Tax=Oscillatoria sp. CS-180 TaxID=3021720 RepID=UPI00232AAEE6|nr:sulfotransferase [Oscillatoria sp. CS-180]MDB9528051.1 sulfotransferase [Oscillatoria sp. CS-180]
MIANSDRYAVIAGNGRSGTNWLLTMMDASPLTHCRNEPHGIATSPYHQLPNPPFEINNHEMTSFRWDAFAAWTANTMGERDHHINHPKRHVHRWSQKIGLAYLPARPKVQRFWRPLIPALQRGEWPMPFWVGNSRRLKEAVAVFKLTDMKAWTVEWVLQQRSHIPVIHIIRHPGGQLNSGIKRFFSTLTPTQQERERFLYQSYLKQGVAVHPEWAEIIGDIDALSMVEAVAWFWRYNNEMIFIAGKYAPNYLRIIYEDLVQDPLAYARKVYDFCHLPWTPEIETIIGKGLTTSVWGKLDKTPLEVANDWKSKLAPDYQEVVHRVLESSIMESWWGQDEKTRVWEPSPISRR